MLEADLQAERGTRAAGGFRLEARLRVGAELAVLLGPSGAGKSSLLDALLGALRPTGGSIRLAGRQLFEASASIDVPIRDRRIGMVFQDALLFPHLDALGNVALAIRRPDRLRRAEQQLERVGALAFSRRRPADLSGGERQRVALARALATEPDLLLLDEPFSALDPAARELLGALLVELQRERQIPFLHVTHDLGEAMRIAAQVIVLERGRTIASGRPQDVLAASSHAPSSDWSGSDNLLCGTVAPAAQGYERDQSEVDVAGLRIHTPPLGLAAGSRVTLRLRAEDILVALEPYRGSSARNVIAGVVRSLRPIAQGIEVEVATPIVLRARVTTASVRELGLAPGGRVHLLIKATSFNRLS